MVLGVMMSHKGILFKQCVSERKKHLEYFSDFQGFWRGINVLNHIERLCRGNCFKNRKKTERKLRLSCPVQLNLS